MSILNTSASGMAANSAWLSTISQNVANANTNGYKAQESEFASLFNQAANSGDFGGTGTATRVRSVNEAQGAIVAGSSLTNLAIQGAGFFVVSDGSGAPLLTRSGAFVPDAAGNLVNGAGYYLMGYDVSNGDKLSVANSLAGMSKINVTATGVAGAPSTEATLSVNLPATAADVATTALPSANAGNAQYTEKTSIVGYDSLGGAKTLDIYMTKSGTNTWDVAVFDRSAATSSGGFPYSSGPLATTSLSFDATTGRITSPSSLSVPVPGGRHVSLDLSSTTQFSSDFAVYGASANGNAPNPFKSVSIGPDGTVAFNYSDGTTRSTYRVPLANVASPDNLEAVNGTALRITAASGQPTVGVAGKGGMGSMLSTSVENSTVDLATELTQMISAQSAYQANSKVYQAGVTILDVLNNLKS